MTRRRPSATLKGHPITPITPSPIPGPGITAGASGTPSPAIGPGIMTPGGIGAAAGAARGGIATIAGTAAVTVITAITAITEGTGKSRQGQKTNVQCSITNEETVDQRQ